MRSIIYMNPSSRDFVKVLDEKYQPEAVVVEAKAGDLILWDSRVIHGSKVGPAVLEAGGGLARCTGLVCMTPRDKGRISSVISGIHQVQRLGGWIGRLGCPHQLLSQ